MVAELVPATVAVMDADSAGRTEAAVAVLDDVAVDADVSVGRVEAALAKLAEVAVAADVSAGRALAMLAVLPPAASSRKCGRKTAAGPTLMSWSI